MKGSRRGAQVSNPAHSMAAPAAVGASMRPISPKISTRGGTTVIAGRELVGPVSLTGVSNYTAGIQSAMAVNPGSFNLFPKLAEIAAGFEQFKLTQMKFVYEGACPTVTAGQVVLSWDPDSSDGVPGSTAEALAMPHSGVAPPYGTITINPPNMDKLLYVDSGTDRSQRLINHGIVVLSATGETTLGVGYLWAEYTCELTGPQLRSTSIELLRANYGGFSTFDRIGPNYATASGLRTLVFTTPGNFYVTVVVYNTNTTPNPALLVGDGLTIDTIAYTVSLAGGTPRTTWVIDVTVLDPSDDATILFPDISALTAQITRIVVARMSRIQQENM